MKKLLEILMKPKYFTQKDLSEYPPYGGMLGIMCLCENLWEVVCI